MHTRAVIGCKTASGVKDTHFRKDRVVFGLKDEDSHHSSTVITTARQGGGEDRPGAALDRTMGCRAAWMEKTSILVKIKNLAFGMKGQETHHSTYRCCHDKTGNVTRRPWRRTAWVLQTPISVKKKKKKSKKIRGWRSG